LKDLSLVGQVYRLIQKIIALKKMEYSSYTSLCYNVLIIKGYRSKQEFLGRYVRIMYNMLPPITTKVLSWGISNDRQKHKRQRRWHYV